MHIGLHAEREKMQKTSDERSISSYKRWKKNATRDSNDNNDIADAIAYPNGDPNAGDLHIHSESPLPLPIEERKIQRGKDLSGSASRTSIETPPLPSASSIAVVDAPTARQTMWRDGLSIIRHLIGCGDSASRKLLGKMLANSQDDCICVVQIFHEGQSLRPMPDGKAWPMAAAGSKRRPTSAPVSKTAWANNLVAKMADPVPFGWRRCSVAPTNWGEVLDGEVCPQ